ncbi:hypothetical protein JCM14469_22930 [Desulfatiferula olefinivorans]
MNHPAVLNALIRKIGDIPTLPSVVVRILRLTSDPDSAVEDFMDLIRCDPSLTTLVLRLANSAYYGQIREIGTLREAIALLGLNEIRNAVVGRAIFASFRQMDTVGEGHVRGLWRHAFRTGLAARIMAKDIGDGVDYFIPGLIHDIGKPVLLSALSSAYVDLIETHRGAPWEIHAREKNILGLSHEDVGRALLRRWLFPDRLTSAVAHHHHPDRGGDHPGPVLIYLADMVSYPHHDTDLPMVPPLDPQIDARARSAGIPWNETTVAAYRSALESEADSAREMFDLISA